ncbi:MAG TPA: hypothetical protein VK485_07965 [Sphingomicrobium sp.]|nr:hypothetical protein [Sphingomicrobium sp.]
MILAALLLAAAQPQALVGFYRAHQMEVGAALELDGDGHFQYQLDYGAASESAEGSWSSDGKTVYLTATTMTGMYKQPAFAHEPLAIDGNRLLLRRYDAVIGFELENLPAPADTNKKMTGEK